MKIKITRYHFTPTRMATNKKTIMVVEDAGKLDSSYTVGGNVKCSHLEKQKNLAVPQLLEFH